MVVKSPSSTKAKDQTRMNSEQFTAVVKQAQVRFGCTEAQAVRLAKSFASDVGKSLMVGKVSGETGLATLPFPDGVNWVAMTPAIRLVRLLQQIEAMDKANIGLPFNAKFELTPEMDSWLRKVTEPSAKLVEPIISQGPSNPPVYVPEAFKRCRFCRRPAMPGSDLCYTCESD
jgi:hypothetical protein